MKKITIDDKTINYKVEKTNNKNTYLKVVSNYVLIRLGKFNKEVDAIKLLNLKFDYFYNALNSSKYLELNDNEIILEHNLYKLIINFNKTFSYEILGNNLIVNTNLKDITKIKLKIYKAHVTYMLEKINSDINNILKLNNISVLPIELKYFKSKYGSYHKNKNIIKLNIILAKGSINELKYVLLHEYAHTINFDHSKNFYNTLSKLMPNYKKYDKSVKNISIFL